MTTKSNEKVHKKLVQVKKLRNDFKLAKRLHF